MDPVDRMIAWLKTLQRYGCRLTGPRYIVAQIMASSERALNPQEVFEKAREVYPSLGLTSVYRTLEVLEELKLIQRLHRPDKCQSYIAAFSGHEHILVCSDCGLVELFQGDDLDLLIQRIEQNSGYQIKEHWLQFFGLCKDCQKNQPEEEFRGL